MTSTNEPSEIFDAEAIANAVEFWRSVGRVPVEVLENVAASHEALRRELDELDRRERDGGRKADAVAWLGEANDLALELRRERDEARRERDELRSAARDLMAALDADINAATRPQERIQLFQNQIDAAARLRSLAGEDTAEGGT